MQIHGKTSVHDDEATKLLCLLQELTAKNNSTTTGVRQTYFIKKLLDLVDQFVDEHLVKVSPKQIPKSKNHETAMVLATPSNKEQAVVPHSSVKSAQPQPKRSLIRQLTKTDTESSTTTYDYSEIKSPSVGLF